MGYYEKHAVGIRATPHREWAVMKKKYTEVRTGVPKQKILKNRFLASVENLENLVKVSFLLPIKFCMWPGKIF